MHGRHSKSYIAYSSAKTWVKGNAFFDIIRESTVGWSQSGAPLHAAALASLYGGAGSVIVFLIWVYYSTSILLFGAKFTQVYRIRILNSGNND
jgi:hypothetical protein